VVKYSATFYETYSCISLTGYHSIALYSPLFTRLHVHCSSTCPVSSLTPLQHSEVSPMFSPDHPNTWSPTGCTYLISRALLIKMITSKIRHEDFLRPLSFVLRPSYVTLRLPPLDSETGWTGELWSNRVLLILEN
jgi:hypothetical protein